jgi:MFS family permease
LGLVNSIGGIAGAGISVPTGWLADRYGIRKMFLLGMPLMALGSLIFALSHDWLMTIPALFISLLSLQMLMTVCPMVCGTYLKRGERATGMQICDTLSAVPGIISPMIAAAMITEFGGLNPEGIRPLYIFQTIVFLLLSALVLRFYRDTIERKETSRSRDMTGVLGNIGEVFVKGKAVKRWILIDPFPASPIL